MLRAVLLCVPDHGKCARAKQGAQISIALLGDAAELFSATARTLFRHEPDPRRKLPPRSKRFRLGDAGDERGCQCRPNAWNGIEPFAGLVRVMPTDHALVENADLLLQRIELDGERYQAGADETGY